MDRAEVEKISKALADETRLTILEAISASPELTCGEIVSQRRLTPATISHHLRVLQDAGLIECRKEGQFVHSRTIPARMKAYAAALRKIAGGSTSAKTARGKG
jgi:ArsR family transcriptional regulator, arsenate/arsenite/antimonite-responsive transcriptional repressor